jgi:hypothetical protein
MYRRRRSPPSVTKFETLISLMAGIAAMLGYAVWLMRRIARALRWAARLPDEHEWLMSQVATHTREIERIMNVVRVLAERK